MSMGRKKNAPPQIKVKGEGKKSTGKTPKR